MSTAGIGSGSVDVDAFRAAWRAEAKRAGVRAPLPPTWQDNFHRWKAKGIATFELVSLIPNAVKARIENPWAYYNAVVRNRLTQTPVTQTHKCD